MKPPLNVNDTGMSFYSSSFWIFLRNLLIIFIVFFGAGCYEVTDYCENGTTSLWIDGLGVWLNLALQSGVIGFVVTLVVSFLLYTAQLNKVKEWTVTKSPHVPPSLPTWLIPISLIVILVIPFFVFLPLICSMRWAHVVGMCMGSFVAWRIIFKIYYLNKLDKLT